MATETNTIGTPFPKGPTGLDGRVTFTYPHNNKVGAIHDALMIKAEATVLRIRFGTRNVRAMYQAGKEHQVILPRK